MADKIFEDDTLYIKRFACDCMYPFHILDISAELSDKDTRLVNCSLNLYMIDNPPIKWRLKQIWSIVRGNETNLADFVIRQQDIPEIIEILNRAISKEKT